MISTLASRRNPVASNAFRAGRAWKDGPDAITIHVTEGSAAGVRSWFAATRDNPTSAHYMITVAGGTEWFVDEADTAYHAGQLDRPSHPLVIQRYAAGKYTPNSYAIGIEHEGDGHHELTDPQRAASVALIVDICIRYGFPCDRTHVFGHHEVKKEKPCPGAIDVDRLVTEAAARLAQLGKTTDPHPPAPAADVSVPVYAPSLGWLIPVSVRSDNEWTFVSVSEVQATVRAGRGSPRVMEAGIRLSALKRAEDK